MKKQLCFSGGSNGKESACNAGDSGLILGQEDSLEKEMVTHSSILAWRIPWTEKPGRLQSAGSQSRTRLSDFTFPFPKAVAVILLCFIIQSFIIDSP